MKIFRFMSVVMLLYMLFLLSLCVGGWFLIDFLDARYSIGALLWAGRVIVIIGAIFILSVFTVAISTTHKVTRGEDPETIFFGKSHRF